MPDLERVQQNTPITLSEQWYESGAAVDPGTVTVGITRADGTVLVAAGTATSGSGTNARTFNLTTAHTALLDRLTVTWTSTLKGFLASYVEVVGGFLFSIVEARALPPLSNTTTYPTATIADTRTAVEEAIELEYGAALVPRYAYETLNVDVYGALDRLQRPVRAIRSVTVDGTALTVGQLADLTYRTGNVGGYTWRTGVDNVTVGYEHGLDKPPGRLRMDAARLARQYLVNGPVDDRASTFSTEGGTTYGLLVPGRGSSIFGLPDLDAAINASIYRADKVA